MSNPSRPPGYPRGESTRCDILSAAMKIFAHKGYYFTSINDIISAVNITKGAFYHHWASKEELAIEVLEFCTAESLRKLQERMTGTTTAKQRLDGYMQFIGDIHENPDLSHCTLFMEFACGVTAQDKRLTQAIHEGWARMRGRITEMLRAAQEEGSVRDDIPADKFGDMLVSAIVGFHVTTTRTIHDTSFRELVEVLQRTWQPQ